MTQAQMENLSDEQLSRMGMLRETDADGNTRVVVSTTKVLDLAKQDEQRQINTKRQAARISAFKSLAKSYPSQFTELYNAECDREGVSPGDNRFLD